MAQKACVLPASAEPSSEPLKVRKLDKESERDLVPTPPAGLIFPATRTEFVNLIAHYYRGEIGRMTSWRDRVDRTSNWAITVTAAMLSVSLTTPTAHHGVLLFAAVLVLLLLAIESRRYRFFDVYRSRVRRLERNYFASIFSPTRAADDEWMRGMADDLQRPAFSISLTEAMSRRLRRRHNGRHHNGVVEVLRIVRHRPELELETRGLLESSLSIDSNYAARLPPYLTRTS